jgi:AraC family transcriptional regulator, regulatory protein of adaptative response / methylated-DNA-[protein]-cysteine methyltransferase
VRLLPITKQGARMGEVAFIDMRQAASAKIGNLNFADCERIRHGRDAAFDGVIFIAVLTTRIYCRPVCPVRQPLSKNVRYYPSAAAAEVGGFRPCLRCRPETAPFSPAWNGTRTTVGRALRLIAAGALDEADVSRLADRLGIGPRHLVRLFRKHLGSPPSRVARSMRVQRAKRLIDETALPMAEIAGRAGFASIRSFNASFREVYRCAPSVLRRRAQRA